MYIICLYQPEPGEAEDFSLTHRLAKCWNFLGLCIRVSLSHLTCQWFCWEKSDFNPECVKAKHLWQMLWHLQFIAMYIWYYFHHGLYFRSILFIKWTTSPPFLLINWKLLLSITQHKLIFGFLSSNFQPINNRYVVVECQVVLVYFCSRSSHIWYSMREGVGVWCMIRVCNIAFVLHLKWVVWPI